MENKDIEEAQKFLLLRIEAEISAERNIEGYMMETARRIVAISKKYDIPPRLFRFSANDSLRREVEQVIKELKEKIADATETLAVYDREEDRDAILEWLGSERYGKTFRERLAIYADRYKMEIEAAIAAGLFLGKPASDMLGAIKSNLKSPYNNPDIRASFRRGLTAARVRTQGVSYGTGHSNSARNLITTLSRNEIAGAWMWWYGERAMRSGATGFYSFRGSGYPCGLCDSMVGWHPISEYQGHYHLNCRCFFVFV